MNLAAIRSKSAAMLTEWKRKQLNLPAAEFDQGAASAALSAWHQDAGIVYRPIVVGDPCQLGVLVNLLALVEARNNQYKSKFHLGESQLESIFTGAARFRETRQLMTAVGQILVNLGVDPGVTSWLANRFLDASPRLEPEAITSAMMEDLRLTVAGCLRLFRELTLVSEKSGSNETPTPTSVIRNRVPSPLAASRLSKAEFICDGDHPWLCGIKQPQTLEAANSLKLAVAAVKANYYTVSICGLVLICQPPLTLVLDQFGRRHCDDGPAVVWASGICEYYWRGIETNAKAILNPELLNAEEVFAEPNAEQRRVLAERMTWLRLLASVPSRLLSSRVCQLSGVIERLYEVQLQPGNTSRSDRNRVFRVIDPSTLREYALGVPVFTATCEEAQRYINHGFDRYFISVS